MTPDSAVPERVSDEWLEIVRQQAAEGAPDGDVVAIHADMMLAMTTELQERRALDKKETGR